MAVMRRHPYGPACGQTSGTPGRFRRVRSRRPACREGGRGLSSAAVGRAPAGARESAWARRGAARSVQGRSPVRSAQSNGDVRRNVDTPAPHIPTSAASGPPNASHRAAAGSRSARRPLERPPRSRPARGRRQKVPALRGLGVSTASRSSSATGSNSRWVVPSDQACRRSSRT